MNSTHTRNPGNSRGSGVVLILVLVTGLVIGVMVMTMARSADTATQAIERSLLATVARSTGRSAINDAAQILELKLNAFAYDLQKRFEAMDDAIEPKNLDDLVFSGCTIVNVSPVTVKPLSVNKPYPWGVLYFKVDVTVRDGLGIASKRTVEEARFFRPAGTDVGPNALVNITNHPLWRRCSQ